MLNFNTISLRFSHHILFSNLSLAIPEQRAVITGENGSGKTTLLMLAAGLIQPDSGEIQFRNESVNTISNKTRIGISANKIVLPTFFTARELLAFHCSMHTCKLDLTLADALGLTPFLHTKVTDLSLGNYKKLSLLTALLHQPELLLLDEPTNGLDDDARDAMNGILNNFSGQIIIASHDTALLTVPIEREISMQQVRCNV